MESHLLSTCVFRLLPEQPHDFQNDLGLLVLNRPLFFLSCTVRVDSVEVVQILENKSEIRLGKKHP